MTVDPVVETLWPLPVAEFSVATLRTWTEETLRSKLTGDALHDNLIVNKWEFAHGVTVLKSYPWRLSVPFVLCNAHCEFCAAWQMKGPAPLNDLIGFLDGVHSRVSVRRTASRTPLMNRTESSALKVRASSSDSLMITFAGVSGS